MDTGQRLVQIVQTQNISMVSEKLCDEVVPEKRSHLQRLLIEEENRFGFFSWQFDLGSATSRISIRSWESKGRS